MLAVHAFEGALPHFARAWRAQQALPFDSESAAILAGLGFAQAATAVRWHRQEGWVNLRRAIEYYLRAGEISRAVAVATHPCITAEGATNVAEVIERILDVVPRGSTEQGWLLARLGAALYFETGDYRRAQATFGRALEVSETAHEPGLELRTLAYASSVDHFDLRWQEVIAKSRRARDLARRVDDLHPETYASYRAAYALMQTGCADEAGSRPRQISPQRKVERPRTSGGRAVRKQHACPAARRMARGRAHSDRGWPSRLTIWCCFMGACFSNTRPATRNQVALTCAASSRQTESPGHIRWLARSPMALSQIARLSMPPPALAAPWATQAGLEGRRPSIPTAVATSRVTRALLALREPHAGECETELEFLEPFKGAILAPGLVTDRLLGLLAHAAGQRRRAIARFGDALAFCRRSGYRPELAWTCHDYAGVLLDTERREDRMTAAKLLDESYRVASELGQRPLVGRIAAFRERYRFRLDRKPAGLTNRELEILILQRQTNKQTHKLFISTNTVAVHVARVLGKTRCANRTEAAAYAARHHLLEPTGL
jgi:DNA-binding CsgD family transcriptional regulator